MNRKYFTTVWYADEKRNRSITKMVVFSDRGLLDVAEDSFTFFGKKTTLKISDITGVSLARQQVGWLSYLITDVMLLLCLLLLFLLLLYFASPIKIYPGALTYKPLLLMLLFSNVAGFVISYSTKWVRVEYYNANHQITRAFFADSSVLGWGGIFGRTENMYHMLKPLEKGEKRIAP